MKQQIPSNEKKPWCAPVEKYHDKAYKQLITDIKVKVEWNNATAAERNILNIHNKNVKKGKIKW